ncbi:MAG TPA: hypothetical protein VFZ91_04695 [Allosphingosinicella sp.]
MTDTPENEAPPPIITTNAPAGEPSGDTAQAEEDYELWDAQDQSKKLRATFATRLYVEPAGEHLRLSFGERISDETVYHTALVVPAETAIEMAQLIYRLGTGAVDAKMDRLQKSMAANAQADHEANG